MTRHGALTQMLALTEAALAQCERGEATPQTILDLAQQRNAFLELCTATPAATEAERQLVTQLKRYDALLIEWCSATQHELELTRSRIATRDPNVNADARVLTDIA